FRHFPQVDLYPNSQRAAEVAEAAGAQGQFWQMHDYLFQNPLALDDESLRQIAIALGLDIQKFITEIETGVHARRVLEDFNSGARSGVSQPPAFFINGIRYKGALDLPNLIDAIQEAGADMETS
nr:DsbA family protein [Hydrococcus sp. Prado102]